MAGAEDTDESLVARAGKGDHAAASELVMRHADRIVATAYRMLGERSAAEDAAQETFLRLWTNASRWRPQGASFSTWLVKIAANVCIDRLRRRGREVREDAAPELQDRAMRADERLMARDRDRALHRALSALPDRQRAAIVLVHLSEMANGDAAQALGVSIEALESLLARGRRSLRAALIADRESLVEGGTHDVSSLAY